MRASDISQLPVILEEKLIGIVDEEDLLLTVFSDRKNFTKQVNEVMTKDLDITQVDASEETLFKTLQNGKVVIVYKDETFLGFITKVDLINKYKSEFKQLN